MSVRRIVNAVIDGIPEVATWLICIIAWWAFGELTIRFLSELYR